MQYNMTSVWVTGATGRLGSAVVKALKKSQEYKVFATDLDVDVTDLEAVRNAADIYRPNVIINCAGVSDEKFCNENEVETYRINTLGARNLAIASNIHNAKIIQISTDSVFSGENNRSKNEFDVPTPNTIFGKSNLAAEKFVSELNPKHLIIRSSWVYGSGKNDICSYVLEKGKAGESFDAAVDRISSPTSIRQIVKFIMVMLKEKEYGIYHASCEGFCSLHTFAATALSYAGFDPSLAKPVVGQEGGLIVSTSLDNLMMKMTGVYEMPQWQDALKSYIDKWLKKEANNG